jgi:hypothetical protein
MTLWARHHRRREKPMWWNWRISLKKPVENMISNLE